MFGFGVQGIVSVIVGSILLGVGLALNSFNNKNVFISIPIFKTTFDGFDKYGAVEYVKGKEFYPNQEVYNITIDSGEILNYLDSEVDLYLYHNIWGLNMSLLISSDDQEILSASTTYNFNNIVDRDVLSEAKHLSLYEEIDNTKNMLFTYCPSPTLITLNNNIDQLCKKSIYPMRIPGKFSKDYIGRIDFSEYNRIVFNFKNLEVLPKNFIGIPQVYINGTKKKIGILPLVIIGSILIVIGIVSILFTVYVIATFPDDE